MRFVTGRLFVVVLSVSLTMTVASAELTEKMSLGGVLSAALQCQSLSSETPGDDTCRMAVPFQPELTYQPSSHDRLLLKLGFAAGNGLNPVSPFNVSAWGADLEDDVKNINGSGRDHLLELWYERTHEFASRNRLGVSGGIIDATRYLDQNRYANDEYIQFMSPALSNAPNSLLPSYDPGIAVEWRLDRWSFAGVIMDVTQSTSAESYTFYGIQAGYHLESRFGYGNYRVLLSSDRGRVASRGSGRQKDDNLIWSLDQELGEIVGLFTRIGWRLGDQPINYRAIYSGGIDVGGAAWGRLLDTIGVGLVYLDGGNNRIDNSRIAEAYYRMVIGPYLAVTGDIQYLRDEFIRTPGAEGLVYSVRATFNY